MKQINLLTVYDGTRSFSEESYALVPGVNLYVGRKCIGGSSNPTKTLPKNAMKRILLNQR